MDEQLVVGGVMLGLLVFGLTEFIKTSFKLEGTVVTCMAVGIYFALAMGAQAGQAVPADFNGWFTYAVRALAGGLAVPGFYKFAAKRAPEQYWVGYDDGCEDVASTVVVDDDNLPVGGVEQ